MKVEDKIDDSVENVPNYSLHAYRIIYIYITKLRRIRCPSTKRVIIHKIAVSWHNPSLCFNVN